MPACAGAAIEAWAQFHGAGFYYEGWASENLAEAGSGESNVACSEPAFEVALVLRILRRGLEVDVLTARLQPPTPLALKYSLLR